MDNSDFAKKRLEKDLQELKKLIEAHFKLRANDELELEALKGRIDKRRVSRAEQVQKRSELEVAKQEALKAEVEKKESEAAKMKAEADARKKEAMAALNSTNFRQTSGQAKTGGKADRDRKKKALAQRRKPLNVDHLEHDQVMEKMEEMNNYLNSLEEERIMFDLSVDKARHAVTIARGRVNGQMGGGKGKVRHFLSGK